MPPPISFLAAAICFGGILAFETMSCPSEPPLGIKAKNFFFDLAIWMAVCNSASGMVISPNPKLGLHYYENAIHPGAQTERLGLASRGRQPPEFGRASSGRADKRPDLLIRRSTSQPGNHSVTLAKPVMPLIVSLTVTVWSPDVISVTPPGNVTEPISPGWKV